MKRINGADMLGENYGKPLTKQFKLDCEQTKKIKELICIHIRRYHNPTRPSSEVSPDFSCVEKRKVQKA